MKKQFGRSMIEMLGVLAIIGVLSIGGIALYRRAVNNHHANTILDDVNRFAFAIIEKGNYPLGEDLPKSDFKESGIYTLTGHQALSAGQFSILVSNVPKGVCEPLVEKSHIEYKVGVVVAGGSVDDEIIYDTLNTDLCQEMNDVAFYFGDTSGVCNAPEGNTPTPCTVNSDCCGGEFCVYINATEIDKIGNGYGRCETIAYYNPQGATLSNGQKWLHSRRTMNGWTAYSFCEALGLKMTNRAELNCSGQDSNSSCVTTSPTFELEQIWGNWGYHWLDDCRGVWKNLAGNLIDSACTVEIADWGRSAISGGYLGSTRCYTLCH